MSGGLCLYVNLCHMLASVYSNLKFGYLLLQICMLTRESDILCCVVFGKSAFFLISLLVSTFLTFSKKNLGVHLLVPFA